MTFFNAGQLPMRSRRFSGFVRDFPQDRCREEALYRLAESYRALTAPTTLWPPIRSRYRRNPDGRSASTGELRRGAISRWRQFADAMAPLQIVRDKGDGECSRPRNICSDARLLATQKERPMACAPARLIDAQPPRICGQRGADARELDDAQNKPSEALAPLAKGARPLNDPPCRRRGGAGRLVGARSQATRRRRKLFQTARNLDANIHSMNRYEFRSRCTQGGEHGPVACSSSRSAIRMACALYARKGNLLDSARAEILYDLGSPRNFRFKHWPESGRRPSINTWRNFLAGRGGDGGYDVSWPRRRYDRTQT